MAEAGPEAAALLERALSRYLVFCAEPAVGAAERLDRDRLDSLVCGLYGEGGLLARAGAVICLRDRLRRLGHDALCSRSQTEPAARVRREALVLRAFAREQIARRLAGAANPISAAVEAVASAAAQVHRFSVDSEAIDQKIGRRRSTRALVDAAHLANDWPERRTVGDLVALVLHHLAETVNVRSATNEYDVLCRVHASALRDALWESAEAAFCRRPTPATLEELTGLDLSLEVLSARLIDPGVEGATRCTAIAELYSMAACARALDAAGECQRVLEPILAAVRAGISAEARG